MQVTGARRKVVCEAVSSYLFSSAECDGQIVQTSTNPASGTSFFVVLPPDSAPLDWTCRATGSIVLQVSYKSRTLTKFAQMLFVHRLVPACWGDAALLAIWQAEPSMGMPRLFLNQALPDVTGSAAEQARVKFVKLRLWSTSHPADGWQSN